MWRKISSFLRWLFDGAPDIVVEAWIEKNRQALDNQRRQDSGDSAAESA